MLSFVRDVWSLWDTVSVSVRVKILAQPHQNPRDRSQGRTLGTDTHFGISKLLGKDALERDKLWEEKFNIKNTKKTQEILCKII